MSGASFVSLVGAAYGQGLRVFHFEWTAALVLVVFAVFILPVFLRRRLFTVPEYLEQRFDRRARVNLLGLHATDVAFHRHGGGALCRSGRGLYRTPVSRSLDCLRSDLHLYRPLYDLWWPAHRRDHRHSSVCVLIVGAAIVAGYGLSQVGGWNALLSELDERHVRLFPDADDKAMPWPGIFGIVILGLYYWTLNQYFVQRALGARSLDDGRKGALFAGFLKLFNLFLLIVPGLVAVVLYPTLDSPDKAFPTLTFELLPAGFRGIVLAAMLAAIMSSLDSALNAASALTTMDLARVAWPKLSDRALFALGRVVTGVFMVVAALYAPMIGSFGSLFEYFQSTLAYLVPPFVGVYLAGLVQHAADAGECVLDARDCRAHRATWRFLGMRLPDWVPDWVYPTSISLTPRWGCWR